MDGEETLIKLIVIGGSGVGKTSLLCRFSENKFNEAYLTTIGIGMTSKLMEVNGKMVKFQYWDTMGEEKFRSMTEVFYRGSQGALIVFDVTKRESINQIEYWLESIENRSDGPIDIALVGNKSDGSRCIRYEEGLDLAKRFGISYYETSAKTGEGVSEAFRELGFMAAKRKFSGKSSPSGGRQPQLRDGGSTCGC